MRDDEKIDLGAASLRERQLQGKAHRRWSDLPNSSRKKWREYSTLVLKAAQAID